MSAASDDKSGYCISFILERLRVHRQRYAGDENAPPLFIGLNGIQGAGKTVLASIIKQTLQSPPYNLPTVVFSLDDLYLSHKDQSDLAGRHPNNPLLQHRGQPSTHDIHLAKYVFSALSQNVPVSIPQYNKAAFSGQGDRAPEEDWPKVNVDQQQIVKVVLFEGWAVGFRPLSNHDLELKWQLALRARESSQYVGRLGHHTLESITTINSALKEYDALTDLLDALIHIDASNPQFVYRWRLQQEENLRSTQGLGMTDDQVKNFVDGYYPAYELFLDSLRVGIFGVDKGRQLRIVVGEDRRVKEVFTI